MQQEVGYAEAPIIGLTTHDQDVCQPVLARVKFVG